MFHSYPVLIAGVVLFALTTLFSFVTLPVEINASHRAVNWLENAGITNYETRPMAIDALKWAAYTYVIAAVGSLATLPLLPQRPEVNRDILRIAPQQQTKVMNMPTDVVSDNRIGCFFVLLRIGCSFSASAAPFYKTAA